MTPAVAFSQLRPVGLESSTGVCIWAVGLGSFCAKLTVSVWLTGGRILPSVRAQSGERSDFVVLTAILLAHHPVEMDLIFEEEGPKTLYLHKRRGNVSLCQVHILKASPPGASGRPDTGGEGIGEKIKQEDTLSAKAVCVL